MKYRWKLKGGNVNISTNFGAHIPEKKEHAFLIQCFTHCHRTRFVLGGRFFLLSPCQSMLMCSTVKLCSCRDLRFSARKRHPRERRLEKCCRETKVSIKYSFFQLWALLQDLLGGTHTQTEEHAFLILCSTHCHRHAWNLGRWVLERSSLFLFQELN